jgi:cytochrome P450 family 313
MLAMHPEVQNKVVEELHQVFETADEEVTEEHLKKLEYLEYVINETIRLIPVLPMLSRHTTGEVQLENFTIPNDIEIFIPQFITFRNKKYWGEDADNFNPDRFYPERFSKVHPYAFTPFSQGARICIGKRYGMAVVKIILSHFFRRYKVSTQLKYDEIEYEFNITVKVKQNYMVQLEKREF